MNCAVLQPWRKAQPYRGGSGRQPSATMPRVRANSSLIVMSVLATVVAMSAQQPAAPAVPLPLVAVRPITPPKHPLPPEAESARVTRFAFIAYGDTRSGANGDGQVVHPVHS